MFLTRTALPRRTILRGLGASLALPFLDAMVPAGTLLAQTPARPTPRIGFVYMPNGVARNFTGINYWTPAGEGTAFELSPILAPLAPFRDRTVVVSGLAQHQADAFDDGANGDHTRGTSSWLTGVHCKRTEGADVRNGVSADQIAAAAIGTTTPLPSLELAIDLNFLAGQCENSYSCAYLNTLAWSSPTTPLPTENNPRIVFERLFGEGGTPAQRQAQNRENRSLLDSVMADLGRLQKELGPADRATISEYLDAVREIEGRIQRAERRTTDESLAHLDRPSGIPTRFDEHVRLMFELQWLAFRGDLTRVTTFMLGRELNFRTYPEIGINEGHHGLSHHQDNPAQLAKYARLGTYQAQLFAAFLERLRATPDGDGTLLDHSLFLYGAGLSNPNLHAHYDLPLAVVGGAGGVRGGRHVMFRQETPMTNLLISMLDRVGAPAEKLGDSTGHLTEAL
ncbi:MAG TPA: DUF1552 domain-containing protein [Vicinamibacterales bacterium]|nr:DUF1552 domain-containing protein [Vicinamibacterales bacterium]